MVGPDSVRSLSFHAAKQTGTRGMASEKGMRGLFRVEMSHPEKMIWRGGKCCRA